MKMRFHSHACFKYADLFWEWILASLLLDFFVIYNSPITLNTYELAIYLIALSCAGMFSHQILSLLEKTIKIKQRLIPKYSKFLIAGFAILSILEFILRAGGKFSIPALVAALLVAAPVIWSTSKKLKVASEKNLAILENNKSVAVERRNLMAMIIVILPLFCARLGSLCAAISASSNPEILASYLPFFACALISIAALRPQISLFRAPCKRCQRMTSRALLDIGTCPACDPHSFASQVSEEQVSLNSSRIWNIIRSALNRA